MRYWLLYKIPVVIVLAIFALITGIMLLIGKALSSIGGFIDSIGDKFQYKAIMLHWHDNFNYTWGHKLKYHWLRIVDNKSFKAEIRRSRKEKNAKISQN